MKIVVEGERVKFNSVMKRSFLLLLLFSGVSVAEPLVQETEEITKDYTFTWEGDEKLTSWTLSFDCNFVSDEYGLDVFYTIQAGKHVRLNVNSDGVLNIIYRRNSWVEKSVFTTDKGLYEPSKVVSITLAFSSVEDNKAHMMLAVQNQSTYSFDITDTDVIECCQLFSSKPYLSTNSGVVSYTNVKLVDRFELVPEPATATLAISGLLLLASRRRRR